jgi:pimeloyl-ACP methyl ester carboxylesterase
MSTPERVHISTPGLSISALAWGSPEHPLALCLHGYPDTAWTYRHLGPHLAARGWRVVAPFSRGYAPTGIPWDGAYQVGALVRDALAVRDALGDDRAVVVGHDWGALAAIGAASFPGRRFRRLTMLAVPPIPALLADKRLLLRQVPTSWYTVANQVPVLPELVLDRFIPLLWRRWSPGYSGEQATEDLAHLWDALPTRAHRTAALRYYRANAQPWRRRSAYAVEERSWRGVPPVPTLYLHGARDGCVRSAVADHVRALLPPGSDAQVVPDAGHFLQLERPDTVNDLVTSFLERPVP